ncbi:unnamed protein product, partial [Amoebophrya sp. A25]
EVVAAVAQGNVLKKMLEDCAKGNCDPEELADAKAKFEKAVENVQKAAKVEQKIVEKTGLLLETMNDP